MVNQTFLASYFCQRGRGSLYHSAAAGLANEPVRELHFDIRVQMRYKKYAQLPKVQLYCCSDSVTSSQMQGLRPFIYWTMLE
jgi:hypothetical protein